MGHTLIVTIWGLVCIICFINVVLEIIIYTICNKENQEDE